MHFINRRALNRGSLMAWMSLLGLATGCLPAALASIASAAETEIQGSIAAVTVYRDQARVVRELKLPVADDLQHIRVSGLPNQLVIQSAFTESEPGTDVRTMRIISRRAAVDPDTKKQLDELKANQKDLERQRRILQHNVSAIEQDLLTLDQLVNFSASRVKENLERATLDVQSVTALADFAMQRRRKLSDEYLQAESEIERLTKEIAENDQQQKKLTSGNLKVTHDALLIVDSPQGGTVRLVYDVGGVRWSPRYTVRSSKGADGKQTFALQLDALLVQDSGEAWNDVAVTLATSTPESQAARPLLTPLRVHAAAAGQQPTAQQLAGTSSFAGQPEWLDRELVERNVHLNLMASERQVTELTSPAEVERKVAEDAGDDVSDETYLIDQRSKISNHPQVQTISILSVQLTGELHRVVTPLLSSFAFREAQLTNSSKRNLIAGPANVYLDGQFVGRTTLPPTAASQRLTIGFGIDRQIRTRREMLSREESIQGGNRRSTLKHRLVVSNFHEAPVDIRLMDRVPIAAKDGSISVSVDQASMDKLSKDKLYVRMQRPTGVLRWDLKIPAKSFGSDSYDHEYQYSIELDRQQTIASNDVVQTLGDLRFQKTNMGGGMGGGGTF